MPTPREAFTNSVQREGFSGARVRAADFGAAGETLGRAAQGLGQDIAKVGEQVDRMQEDKAKTDAQEADTARVKARLEVYYGEEGYFNQKGYNAVTAQSELPARLKKIDETYSANLNPRARRMFDEVGSRRDNDEMPKVYDHAFKENNKHKDVVTDSAIEVEAENAAMSQDPTIVDNSLANARRLTREKVQRSGYGDENTFRDAEQKVTGAIVERIAKKTAMDSPLAAQTFVKSKAGDMNPEDTASILASLAPNANKEWASRTGADKFIAEAKGSYYPTAPADPAAGVEPAPSLTKEKPLDIRAGVRMTSDYGPRTRPVKADGTLGSGNHGGWDLGYGEGTPVKATLTGRVENKEGGGYGKYTDLHHGNGLVSRYAHLSSFKFANGATVKQGDVIAASGSTGGVKAHLHYEVRQNDQSIDPAKLKEVAVGDYKSDGRTQPLQTAADDQDIPIGVVIDRIKAAGLSFPLEEATIAEVRERYALGKQVKADAKNEVEDRMAQHLMTMSDSDQFTSYEQLPSDIRRAAEKHPELALRYKTQARANEQTRLARIESQNKEARGQLSEQAEWDALILMSTNPQAFQNMDIRRDFPTLTASDAKRFYGLQQTMRGKGESSANLDVDPLLADVNRFGARVFNTGKGVNDPKAKATMGRVQELAIRMAQQQIKDNGGKPLSDIQRRAIARLVTEPTYVRSKGFTGFVPQGVAGSVRGEGTSVVNKREVARARMAQQTGIEPSEEDISAYLARGAS